MPLTLSSRTLALATLLAGLGGCAVLPSAPGSAKIPDNGPLLLAGELTSRSAINVNDGTRYQSFPLQLEAGQIIEARLQPTFEGQLSLLDDQLKLVNGPRAGVLSLTPTRSGRYQLNLSGDSATRYGPFNLSLSRIEVRNSGTLAANDRLAGLLQSNTPNSYQLTVTQPAIYRISMASDEFDTLLRLSGEGLALSNDDDDSGSTHSRIDTLLQPGRYTLEASSIDDGSAGTYVLSSEQRDLPAGVELHSGGLLKPDAPISGLGSLAPLTYQLRLEQPALITLRMSSSEIDSHLALKGRGIEASDDDGAGNGRDAELSYLLEAGTYEVTATSVSSSTGVFSLSYSSSPMGKGELTSLRPGQYASGALRNDNPEQATLQIRSAGTYQIDLSSSDFDAFLRLEGGDLELQDDDSGGARHARLKAELEPGNYRLQISGVDTPSRGRFRLSAIQLP